MSSPATKTNSKRRANVTRSVTWLITVLVFTTLLAHLLATTYQADNLRSSIYDEVMSSSAGPADFSDFLIVDLDDLSHDFLSPHYGEWPYQRSVMAELHAYLTSMGATLLVYTPLFHDGRMGDLAFADAIRQGPPTVLAANIQNTQETIAGRDDTVLNDNLLDWPDRRSNAFMEMALPVSELTAAGAKLGLAAKPLNDKDEVLRAIDPVLRMTNQAADRVVPSLPLAAVLSLGDDVAAKQLFTELLNNLTENHRLQPIFPSNGEEIERLPLWQLMFEIRDLANGRKSQPEFKAQIQGRVVVVGLSAAGLIKDKTVTPINRLHTHELTVNLMQVMRTHAWVQNADIRWVWLLGLISALLPLLTFALGGRKTYLMLAVGIATIALLIGLFIGLLTWYDIWIDPIFAVLNALIVMLVAAIYRFRAIALSNRQLEIERQAAERTSDLKSQFLATITHELRTPLTSVLGYNRVLLDESSHHQENERYHKIIDSNCRHLLTLINNLLSEAEIEAGKVEHKPEATRIREVLTDALHSVEGLALDKQLQLSVNIDAAVPRYLWLDGLRLRQVIINLASNAVKYTPAGNVTIQVAWRDDQLTVAVSDTGPGMSSKQLEMLFTRFSGRNDVRLDSSGLGLSICYELVEVMDGHISLDSQVGKGSVFTVVLPAKETQAVEASTAIPDDVKTAGFMEPELRHDIPVLKPLEVVVVDDNLDIRMLMEVFLRKAGHRAVTIETAEEAIHYILRQQPDIVFMDLNLPGMSGREAVKVLRAQQFEQPIVLCSAAADIGDVPGCNAYLPKPMRRDAVLGTIEDLVVARNRD